MLKRNSFIKRKKISHEQYREIAFEKRRRQVEKQKANREKNKYIRLRDRRDDDPEYWRRRRAFMEREDNHYCPVAASGVLNYIDSKKRTTELHHIRGRVGELMLDERFWMAVSREGHKWIHDHAKTAEENLFKLPADRKRWKIWVLNHPLVALTNGWANEEEIAQFEWETKQAALNRPIK